MSARKSGEEVGARPLGTSCDSPGPATPTGVERGPRSPSLFSPTTEGGVYDGSERCVKVVDDLSVLTEDRGSVAIGAAVVSGGRAKARRERLERKDAAKAKRKERRAAKEDDKVWCSEVYST